MSDPIRAAGSTPKTFEAAPAAAPKAAPTKEQIDGFVSARRDALVDGLLKQGLIKEEHATAMKAAPLDQWTNVFHGWSHGGGGGGWGHGGGGWGHGGGGGWGHGGGWGPGPGWGHGGGGWGHGGGGGWGHGGGGWGHR